MNQLLKNLKFLFLLVNMLFCSKKYREGSISKDKLLEKVKNFRIKIEQNGPTYIKFGQILSVRYDFFPEFACHELQKLLDDGEKLPFSYIQETLKIHLNDQAYRQINYIEPEPIGVASLGQVHRAVLNTGEVVAIKVQKPNIKARLKKDLKFLARASRITKYIPILNKLRLYVFIEEFCTFTLREIDYLLEAHNMELFAETHKAIKDVYIPKVYWKLTNDTVLTTEFIEGIKLKEILNHIQKNDTSNKFKIDNVEINKEKIVSICTSLIYQQVIKDGFIHGDPHPSNLIINSKHQLVLLDFGITARLTRNQKKVITDTVKAIVSNDVKAFIKLLLIIDQEKGVSNIEKLEAEMVTVLDAMETNTVSSRSITSNFFEFIWKASKYDIQWPHYFTVVAKVFATIDSTLAILSPSSNILKHLTDLDEIAILNETQDFFNVKKKALSAYQAINEFSTLVTETPHKINEFLSDIRQGGIPIRVVSDLKINDNKENKNKTLSYLYLFASMGFLFYIVGFTNASAPIMIIYGLYSLVSNFFVFGDN